MFDELTRTDKKKKKGEYFETCRGIEVLIVGGKKKKKKTQCCSNRSLHFGVEDFGCLLELIRHLFVCFFFFLLVRCP